MPAGKNTERTFPAARSLAIEAQHSRSPQAQDADGWVIERAILVRHDAAPGLVCIHQHMVGSAACAQHTRQLHLRKTPATTGAVLQFMHCAACKPCFSEVLQASASLDKQPHQRLQCRR